MWFLAFRKTTPVWWVRWLARGRFQHVSAFGWVPATRLWIFYDVGLFRTQIYALPAGDDANAAVDALHENAVVVSFCPRGDRPRWVRLGFWCVPATSHLVGLKATVFRPDAMFRAALHEGGHLCGASLDRTRHDARHGRYSWWRRRRETARGAARSEGAR